MAIPAGGIIYGHPDGAHPDPTCNLWWFENLPDPIQFGPPPYPCIILFPPGGYRDSNPNQCQQTAHAMTRHGFICFSSTYRVLNNKVDGQTTTGFYPQQAEDIVTAITAARNDSRVIPSRVFGMGGSGGGTHVMEACVNGPIRFNAAVSFSGGYNFAERTPEDYTFNFGDGTDVLANFVGLTAAYVNADPTDLTTLSAASTVTHMQADTVPVMVWFSEHDPMPFHQYLDIQAKFAELNVAHWETHFLPGLNTHAFKNFGSWNEQIIVDFFNDPTSIGGGGMPPPPPPDETSGFRMTLTGGPYTIVGAAPGGILPFESRTAELTDLAAGRAYHAELVPFNLLGDGEAATYDFTTPTGNLPVYVPGVWGLFGAGDTITAELKANLGIVGVNLNVDWSEVNSAPGVFDFTPLTTKIQNAKDNGFQHINAGVTWSQTSAPNWLKTDLLDDSPPGALVMRDPGHEGSTFCHEMTVPIYWNTKFHAARLALIAALGPVLNNDPAINAVFCSFANHRSMDWNTFDAQQTLVGCPANTCPVFDGNPCNIPIDQPKQWNDAGWTKAKVLQVGREIITAVANAFPNKCMKLPIGGMHDDLANFSRTVTGTIATPNINMPQAEFLAGDEGDTLLGYDVNGAPCFPSGTTVDTVTNASNIIASANATAACVKIRLPDRDPDIRGGAGNYSSMAAEILAWLRMQPFSGRVYVSRNTASATWQDPPTTQPGFGGEAAIKYLIAQNVPLSGLQTVTSATQCVADCTTPCRLAGNATVCAGDPVYPTVAAVMQAAYSAMLRYGKPLLPQYLTFIEAWSQDAKNPAFYAMTTAATLAMGGTPRT